MRGAFIFVVLSLRLQRVYAVRSVPGWSLRSQAALPYEFRDWPEWPCRPCLGDVHGENVLPVSVTELVP